MILPWIFTSMLTFLNKKKLNEQDMEKYRYVKEKRDPDTYRGLSSLQQVKKFFAL